MLDRLDDRILKFFQDWIVDPLQWSGIKLEWQVRVVLAITAFGFISVAFYDAMHRRFIGLAIDGWAIPVSIRGLMFGHNRPVLQVEKTFGTMCICGLTFTSAVLPITGRWDACLLFIGLVLNSYVPRCKPKPPAENLHTSTERA